MATLATPDTLMRWYKRLIAQKFDGSPHRTQLGRPPVAREIEQLVIRMAEENATWGYRRIQGALANLGQSIDKLTVRNICAATLDLLYAPLTIPLGHCHIKSFQRASS